MTWIIRENKNFEFPTMDLIENYNKKFDEDEKANAQDMAIKKLIEEHKENNELHIILLKVAAINSLYSTNIYNTFKMAEHILKLNIDQKLKNPSTKIVQEIANLEFPDKTGKEIKKNMYSFATKYCNWHENDLYPIYDSFVERLLKEYRKESINKKPELNFSKHKWKNKDLKNYDKFREIIKKFKESFKITDEVNYKKLDKFLWYYHKDIFEEKR